MVIVGGRQSANTAQLAEVCRKVNPRVLMIESAEELHEDWFQGLTRVGVSAGASTRTRSSPRWWSASRTWSPLPRAREVPPGESPRGADIATPALRPNFIEEARGTQANGSTS